MNNLKIVNKKLVQGIGFNDAVSSDENGKLFNSYHSWKSMLERCYSSKYHEKFPTYKGCTVCADWLFYSNFKKWYEQNNRKGYHLDKDILVYGNKIYSPETCRYVPEPLNLLLTDRRRKRGDYPKGVSFKESKNTYQAQCSVPPILNKDNKSSSKYLGCYSTPDDAAEAYNIFKADIIRRSGQAYYDNGCIGIDLMRSLFLIADLFESGNS